MKFTYSDLRRLDDKLDRIEAAVTKAADNEAELDALRGEVAELRASIAAAVDTTDEIEKGASEGLPASPQ